MHATDEVAQHLLGHVEVRDDAVLEGADGHDVAGRAPEHRLGLLADSEHGVVGLVDGDDRGLVEDDALTLDVDEGVGRAQVNSHIVREEASN